MVRPVVPAALTGPVGSCQAVRADPLLRLVWTTSEWGKLAGRARGMLAEVAKRRGIEEN